MPKIWGQALQKAQWNSRTDCYSDIPMLGVAEQGGGEPSRYLENLESRVRDAVRIQKY